MDENSYKSQAGRANSGSNESKTSAPKDGKTSKGNGEKIKTESSRSEAMKGKFKSKKGESSKKMKKTGGGKTGKKRPKLSVPKPSLPEASQMDFTNTGTDDSAAEKIVGKAGMLGIPIAYRIGKKRAIKVRGREAHDWGDLTKPRQVPQGEIPWSRGRVQHSSTFAERLFGIEHRYAAPHETSDGMHSKKILTEGKTLRGDTLSEGESNPWSKRAQKANIKKDAIKRASSPHHQTIGDYLLSASQKIEAMLEKFTQSLMLFAKNNPLILILAGTSFIGAISATSTFGIFGLFLSGGGNAGISTTFTAKDSDILAVEADYVSLEEGLQERIDNIETDYPDYDEYNYDLAEIKHNPYELAALLTVLYEDYTEAEVKEYLNTIFNGQYTLSLTEKTEKRKKTVTKWHLVTKYREEEMTGIKIVNGKIVTYTYTVSVPYEVLESYEEEVEYEVKILNTKLTSQSIDSYAKSVLSQDQKARYELLIETKGNKEGIFD